MYFLLHSLMLLRICVLTLFFLLFILWQIALYTELYVSAAVHPFLLPLLLYIIYLTYQVFMNAVILCGIYHHGRR